ncbi:MAG: class I SAM-dependent methyltransferase [Bacteroidota bacterium]
MNEFDIKAGTWDLNPLRFERSEAVAEHISERIPLSRSMSALEFGAGTGITGFILKDHVKEITMMDNSREMIRKIEEKILATRSDNVHALFFDLENDEWEGEKFDLLITQMVLHHIPDSKHIINNFYNILNPGGYLAIADLYPEDGSFHGEGFTGHRGFNPDELSKIVQNYGFTDISSRHCYTMNKQVSEAESRYFDLFLLIAKRPSLT